MNKSGDVIGGTFPVVDPTTGGLSAADATPTGVLTVNGVDSAAVVTVTTTGTTGRYKWTCTLPAGIADGDALAIWVAAAVAGVAGGNNVWQGVGCTKRPADVAADTASALATAHGAGSWITATGFELAGAAAAAVAPLAMLVTDWTDGGRLDMLLDEAAGGAGGSYAQTITVTAGGVAVQGATVQILDAADDSVIDSGTTDVSGVVVLRCNALSVKFAAAKSGYTSYTSAATSVTGAAARAVTLTAISITVSSPGKTTLYGNVYDKDLNGEDGTAVTCSINKLPSGDTGRILDSEDKSDTTDASGYFEFTNCLQGATYVVVCGRHRKEVVVGTSDTQGIGSFIK